ncbi:MAG TPA: hypothetical protein PLN52_19215 [Opitutaceae bacterium]|nr:hypothetical protein [Opitutaceae bacterium]
MSSDFSPSASTERPHISKVLDENRKATNRLFRHALADDDKSLDPGNPINANLRDNGVGSVPPLTQINIPSRTARLFSAALHAHVTVPLGWHLIDDRRRLLLFEPQGHVQINFTLSPRRHREPQEVLNAVEEETRASYPHPEFHYHLEGRYPFLRVRKIADGGQELEQWHWLSKGATAETFLSVRLTATPAHAQESADLVDSLLEWVEFDLQTQRPPETSESTDSPGWWHQSRTLEAEGRIAEAEDVIQRGVNHMGAAASVAQMYAERMVRLKASGDMAGALTAFKEADGWISFYASMAMTGDESAALAYERDRFRAGLVRMLGFDPKPSTSRPTP